MKAHEWNYFNNLEELRYTQILSFEFSIQHSIYSAVSSCKKVYNIQHKAECRTLTSCPRSTTSTPVTLNKSPIIPRSHSLKSKAALTFDPAPVFMSLNTCSEKNILKFSPSEEMQARQLEHLTRLVGFSRNIYVHISTYIFYIYNSYIYEFQRQRDGEGGREKERQRKNKSQYKEMALMVLKDEKCHGLQLESCRPRIAGGGDPN